MKDIYIINIINAIDDSNFILLPKIIYYIKGNSAKNLIELEIIKK